MKRSSRTLRFWGLCLTLALVGGCARDRQKQPGQQAPYFGPTLTLEQLVTRVNQNNSQIPTLWSRFNYDIEIKDPQTGKTTAAVDQGKLMYRAPGEFRLWAEKTPVGRVLDIGINQEQFWLVATPPGEEASMWYGEVGDELPAPPAASGNTSASTIPIRPQALLQVLAVGTFNADLTQEPAPVLRFNNDARTYMLTFVAQVEDRYVATREVWYDLRTLLPTLVLLFDADGRVVVRAKLSNHQLVQVEGKPGPTVATDYDLFFPDTRSRMRFVLKDFALQRNELPGDASFRFPGFREVPQSKAVHIDADAQK